MKMTPYPAYKPTGLSWLPQIPEHWSLKKNKYILQERETISNTGQEQLLSLSQYSGLTPKKLSTGRLAESQIGYRIVKKKDIVMNIMLAWNGSTAMSMFNGIVSPAYAVFFVKDENSPKFLHYLFKTPQMLQYFKAFSSGVIESRLRLYPDELGKLFSILPPPDEQTQIVRYLDSMTAKINKLIRAKKKICDLIFEQIIRQTNECIHNAFVPKFKLKNILNTVSEQIQRDNETMYSPLGVLNRGRGIFHKTQQKGKELGDSVFFHVHPGDLIFSGQFAWEGAVAILQDTEDGCIVSHRYHLARAKDPDFLKLEYLWGFFQTKYGDMILNLHSHGAAGRNRPLNYFRLLSEAVPIPPYKQQEQIARLFRWLQLARKHAVHYAEMLNEYKNSLISSVVTGQIDVRDIPVDDFDPADLVSEADDAEEEENSTE